MHIRPSGSFTELLRYTENFLKDMDRLFELCLIRWRLLKIRFYFKHITLRNITWLKREISWWQNIFPMKMIFNLVMTFLVLVNRQICEASGVRGLIISKLFIRLCNTYYKAVQGSTRRLHMPDFRFGLVPWYIYLRLPVK